MKVIRLIMIGIFFSQSLFCGVSPIRLAQQRLIDKVRLARKDPSELVVMGYIATVFTLSVWSAKEQAHDLYKQIFHVHPSDWCQQITKK